ncbi:acyl-CoA N-acyltransferase [Scenedesmus sp. NREL 46B-D3]|nr:acyl-CoA N-acyltransferase [Scenedesmus sp. NREL 46B-D3]
MQQDIAPGYALRIAKDRADFESFARLSGRYHDWLKSNLNVDLCFQGIERELDSLPGRYAQPAGCILLVSHSTSADAAPNDVGCVAVRPLSKQPVVKRSSCSSMAAAATGPASPQQQQLAAVQQMQRQDSAGELDPAQALHEAACELKHLWVEHAHKKAGLGVVLMAAALQATKGYSSMVLETLEGLRGAIRLYDKLGFTRTSSYCANPLPGVVYWRKELGPVASKL